MLKKNALTWEEKNVSAWSLDPKKAVLPSAINSMRLNMAKTSDDGWRTQKKRNYTL